MTIIEQLIDSTDLKFSRLVAASKRGRQRFHSVRYHEALDALIVQLLPSESDTIVYYVDDRMGLLCEEDSLEVVGLQIEGFTHSFLPQHANVRRLWSVKVTSDNFGELSIAYEKREPDIAREVVRATQPTLGELLGKHGEELAAAFA